MKSNMTIDDRKTNNIFILDMDTIAGSIPFQTRRQALTNLALKRDPIPVRQKPAVSFVNDPAPTDGPVNELPTVDAQISVIAPSQSLLDGLPTASSVKKSMSIRSLSNITPMS
jgi:hypothetical protein